MPGRVRSFRTSVSDQACSAGTSVESRMNWKEEASGRPPTQISGTAQSAASMPATAPSGSRSRRTTSAADTPARSARGFRLTISRPELTAALPLPTPMAETTCATAGSARSTAATLS